MLSTPAARLERVENNIAADDREAAAKATQSPFARLVSSHDIDPDTLTDEELASLFPAFAVVWADVVHSLMKREGVSIGKTA